MITRAVATHASLLVAGRAASTIFDLTGCSVCVVFLGPDAPIIFHSLGLHTLTGTMWACRSR